MHDIHISGTRNVRALNPSIRYFFYKKCTLYGNIHIITKTIEKNKTLKNTVKNVLKFLTHLLGNMEILRSSTL